MPSILNIIKAAALLLPAVVSASGTLGFALGIHKNNDQTCKTTEDFVNDLNVIKKQTGATVVRIYTTSQCDTFKTLLPALKQTGTKAVVGLWCTPADHYKLEIQAVTDNFKGYSEQILAFTVGSEHLYRKELTGEQLAAKIKAFQDEIKALGADTPVGFADSWNVIADGTANAAIAQSDIILSNAFSYWQGGTFDNSTATLFDDIMQALQHVQDIKGTNDIPFWIGETNWPTGGADFKKSVPSLENAAKYWKDAICGMLAWGVNTFVFEAFDEPWKPAEKNNDVEQHWGVMDVKGKPKFDLTCEF